MKKRNKSSSSEDEDRSRKSFYTNVQRKLETIPSSKDLELCLEVEMDDEVRELIKCPENSPSTLLDVTVIKPKGLDNLYTTEKQTLNTNQVKKMITSMKIDSDEKLNLMQKIFGEKDSNMGKDAGEALSRKSCLSTRSKIPINERSVKYDQGDVRSVTDRISKVFSVFNQETVDQVNQRISKSLTKKLNQQVYAAPKTYNNIRSMFQCTNNKENTNEENQQDPKKIELPCHCQNCAIMGILTDSQKVPFATEEIPELMHKDSSKRDRKAYTPFRRKSVTFKHATEPNSLLPKDHSECETIFKHLSERIKDLEERVRRQEEKAVPKDYFKKIITKLVNHLTKLTHYTTTNEERNSVKEQSSYKQQSSSPRSKCYDTRYDKYLVNHCQVESTRPHKFPAEKEYEPKPCSSQDEEPHHSEKRTRQDEGPLLTVNVATHCDPGKPTIRSHRPSAAYGKNGIYSPKYDENVLGNESFWKWGGEILKPGIDLKNKIVVLLEDALQNFKKSWEKPTQEQRFHEDLQRFLEEISKNLPKPDKTNFRRESTKERRYSRFTPIRESNSDSSTLNWSKHSKKSKQHSMMSRFMRKKGSLNVPQGNINIAYVNPEVNRWVDSQISFRVHSSDDVRQPFEDESMKLYKVHFLKMIENSKTTDKFKLWQNIWNQALASGQSKNNTVVVQIPDPTDHRNLVKINYTIGDIEKLLTGVEVGHGAKKKR